MSVRLGGVLGPVTTPFGAGGEVDLAAFERNLKQHVADGLDGLAEFCDSGTRVIVIGRHNDVVLYRELVRRGVSDYLISPVGTMSDPNGV